jgi:hypothetical protein
MTKISKTTRKLVDDLGILKAQMAELAKKEADIKAKLLATGLIAMEGYAYRAVVVTVDRTTLDTAIVKGFLTPVQITKASKTTPVTSIRVNARTGLVAEIAA